ncbi:hypothetical protein C8J57DRAFT_1493187 [Mycena rebaudengoi]|nr:hypothetical protein C8J57DRAFT_1493187 [Mycena rebaudengoi]
MPEGCPSSNNMATHKAEDGTGGMDAFILSNQERSCGGMSCAVLPTSVHALLPQNAGDGFSNALAALMAQANRYVSSSHSLGGVEHAFPGIFDNNVATEYNHTEFPSSRVE